jgi:hypothetical protein
VVTFPRPVLQTHNRDRGRDHEGDEASDSTPDRAATRAHSERRNTGASTRIPRYRYPAVTPPSMEKFWPVTQDDSSDAR